MPTKCYLEQGATTTTNLAHTDFDARVSVTNHAAHTAGTPNFIYIPQLGNPAEEADIWLRWYVWKYDSAAGSGFEVILTYGEIPFVYETTKDEIVTLSTETAFLSSAVVPIASANNGGTTTNVRYTEWDDDNNLKYWYEV